MIGMHTLADAMALDSVLNIIDILATIALAVIFALWGRKDQTSDALGDSQRQLVLSKIDNIGAKLDAAITRHDNDIEDLHRKLGVQTERLAVVETENRSLREAVARQDEQLRDCFRRLDAVRTSKGGA